MTRLYNQILENKQWTDLVKISWNEFAWLCDFRLYQCIKILLHEIQNWHWKRIIQHCPLFSYVQGFFGALFVFHIPSSCYKVVLARWWWHMPLLTALRRKIHGALCESEASLSTKQNKNKKVKEGSLKPMAMELQSEGRVEWGGGLCASGLLGLAEVV